MEKITLSRPIMVDGKEVTELEMGEPTLGMLEDITLTVTGSGELRLNMGDLHRIVSEMAGIPPSSAKKISLADAPALMKVAKGFFGSFPTGE
jgi:hypothetical protein